jgi:hypothetical protein
LFRKRWWKCLGVRTKVYFFGFFINFKEFKKTLVLDLDETLIHTISFPKKGAFKVEVKKDITGISTGVVNHTKIFTYFS